MPKTLVIVESPNKAKKLAGFLGPGFTVKASFGHVADLPPKEYGVDLSTLEESYVVRNAKVVRELRALVTGGAYDRVLLASDPDREGEAIAWHLARRLKLGARVPNRIEFREITAAAVRAAVARPRPVDSARVDAQRSRRVLDRIVGFDCSKEICWPAGAKSAGRCQTPALHILCEREREILAFVPRVYWTVEAEYAEGLTAFVPGERAADGEDADGAEPGKRGRLVAKQFATREEADAVLAVARAHPHVVRDVEGRRVERRPPPPYTTSTLQQDASKRLRLTAKQAMDAAQALFEAGAITYHRTDSTRVSDDAAEMAHAFIAEHHPAALPERAARFRAAAGAQDAHEAVRPTKLAGEELPPGAAVRLYAMIKARFLASQSRPALFDVTAVWVDSGPVAWAAEGSVLREAGFLTFWAPYARQEDVLLPSVTPGQRLTPNDLRALEKSTQPPPRYDQGALIKKLETSGIGRPATFAGIIDTLLQRDYVREFTAGRGKAVLQPTEFGLQVDGLLSHAFPELVAERYTADMETQLDEIERGRATRPAYLRAWYSAFREAMGRADALGRAYREAHGLRAAAGARARSGAPAGVEETATRCDRCGEANYRKVARRQGRGSFLACPACRMTRNVRAKVRAGACPKCGSALIEKTAGRRGPFWGCVRYGAAERPCAHAESATAGGTTRAAPNTTPGAPPPRRARKAAKKAAEPEARHTRVATDKGCPRCGRARLAVVTPTDPGVDAPFYACDDAACGFTLPLGARRRRDPCPACGAVVLERRRPGPAGAPFWRCARGPECAYTAPWAGAPLTGSST